MKTSYIALAITVLIFGCATGIVPTDKGEYMSQKTSAGGAMGDPQSVLADLYREANDFCSKTDKAVETISTNPEKGVPFVRPARATLNFRCVTN